MWYPNLNKDSAIFDIIFVIACVVGMAGICLLVTMRLEFTPVNQPDDGGEFEDVSSYIINSGLLYDI